MDRFLYSLLGKSLAPILQGSFRPLSRWIGSYTTVLNDLLWFEPEFPSPLEVDSFLYNMKLVKTYKEMVEFPSPLEVDRFLYGNKMKTLEKLFEKFPSPLEVDRFLYKPGQWHD